MTAMWTRAAAVTAATITVSAFGVGTAVADPHRGDDASIVSATLITEVAPEGYKVAAIALEYDRTLRFGGTGLDVTAFDVDVDLSAGAFALAGDRTITAAYTSATPEITGQQRTGSFVILELDPDDVTASPTYVDWFGTTLTNYYELDGGYTVAQVGDLVAPRDHVPADPGNQVANTAVLNQVIDDYASGSFASDAGPVLDYRYFTPEQTPQHTYPLVVTLHGFGESGSNNFSQIAGNQISTAFASDDRQKEDAAYVLSPQADPFDPSKGAWWAPSMADAVVELIEDFIASHPDIDTSRIYLTGLSMGSYGSWAILEEHPDLFAGAVVVCGGGRLDEAATAAALADLPIWAVHSEDDAVVDYYADGSDFRVFEAFESAGEPVVWSQWSGLISDTEQEAIAKDAAQQAKQSGSDHVFTTIEAGTTPVFSHLSWIPTYSNDVILDWLFEQDADA